MSASWRFCLACVLLVTSFFLAVVFLHRNRASYAARPSPKPSAHLYSGSSATESRIDINQSHDRGSAPHLQEIESHAQGLGGDTKGTSHFGFLLGLNYTGQMISSTACLLSLQCWASKFGGKVRVVEPNLRTSRLGMDLAHLTGRSDERASSVRLTDVYERTALESYTAEQHLTPLVDWDHFIQNAPRRLVVVNRECIRLVTSTCSKKSNASLNASIQMLSENYGFKIVRQVHFPTKSMSDKYYTKLVYGTYAPNEVVVIFNNWGGIGGNFRWDVGINLGRCDRGHYIRSFPLSLRIKKDALLYTQKYLSAKTYISVMVRLEYFMINHKINGRMKERQILSLLQKFYDSILEKVNRFKAELKTDAVFLAMDCGKHGSTRFTSRSKINNLLSNSIKKFYGRLYGNSSTLEDWEESFDSVPSFANTGYTAMLQKHLAASGTCLITAGGGSFQSTTRDLYSKYHTEKECIAVL